MRQRSRATPVSQVESEDAKLESFGRLLYETFDKTVRPSIFDLQLRYYGDYLHHFGFSVETETGLRRISFSSEPTPPACATAQHTHGGLAFSSHDVTTLGDEAVGRAGWGITKAEREEADAQARAVGSLECATNLEEIVASVVEPYQRPSWRQSVTQCAMKKARALYCWLCENITVVVPSLPLQEEAVAAAAKKDDIQKGGAAARATKRKQAAEANQNTAPAEVIDTIVLAVRQRTADPQTIARLYQKCLYLAGVECNVVEGHVRGRAPEEVVEWAWNIVLIPQENNTTLEYLVDVSLSAHTGPLRGVARGKDTVEEVESLKPPALKEPVPAKSKRTAPVEEEKPKRSFFDGPVLAACGSEEGKRMESFYFATHPQRFCATHFPREGRYTLLTSPPRKVVWEGAPCLTHTFFRFPLALASHRRRCAMTVRSTPFHISLINEQPGRTELCCVVYKGALEDLPEVYSMATPLGPQWSWHQREESTGCETFTIMVPEIGYYSVIFGARGIRSDPFSAAISEEPFVPVVAYQVLVTFVPHQVPQLPRQHLSPSICKLLSPLTHQVAEGTARFVVMPSCANVAGVAVVLRHVNDGSRTLLSFLHFSPASVAYIGEINLESSCEAEVWLLYAAPDHNYVNTTELPRVTSRFQANSPPNRCDAENGHETLHHVSQPQTAPRRMAFVPFVTGIEVKKLLVAAKGTQHIQPQPSLEDERHSTMRRLIGVTPELYDEAAAVAAKRSQPVGSYFAREISAGKKSSGDV
ncbi:hypothetical protein DQ04_00711050 [Trypanosoma grayi]|uniref:hypothetical protein n=1 Tax=Trypanosoma grayi TaxID=71804 RepID=UPI0004F455F6|nr:hypothetical protein DQ04_00711050 [Trypanosoma grayi]KEG13927.1 hypothetical protein DQ04_00711050 [Trypanosoma grayi]